jgi:hypothetical protein
MIYGTSQESAERLAAALRDRRIGKYASLSEPTASRRVIGYRVQRYTGSAGWGIVERWVYADRPELGEFGGGFVNLADARALLARTDDVP